MQQILLVAVPIFALTSSLCIALSRLDRARLTAATAFELLEPPRNTVGMHPAADLKECLR